MAMFMGKQGKLMFNYEPHLYILIQTISNFVDFGSFLRFLERFTGKEYILIYIYINIMIDKLDYWLCKDSPETSETVDISIKDS